MKLLLGAFALLLISCNHQPDHADYSIRGNAGTDHSGKRVVLQKFDPINQKATPLDTAQVDDAGQFVFTYKFEEPDLFRVDFPNKQKVQLAIGEGEEDVVVNADGSIEIQGCVGCQLIQEYDAFRKSSLDKWVKPADELMKKARNGDASIDRAEAVATYAKNSAIHRTELIEFAEQKMADSPALYASALRWTGDQDNLPTLENLVSAFEQQYPDLEMTKNMKAKVERFKKVAIGEKAPTFLMKRPDGSEVRLEEGLGQLTLVDFWASWCGPCLLQLPELVEIYDSHKAEGFEVVAFSIDTNEKGWKNAINRFGLEWENGSDLKGYQSPVAVDYNITLIPFNLLLDKNGVIIAKNVHNKELKEILKSKL